MNLHFLLNTKTTTITALFRPPLASLIILNNYTVHLTNYIPSQTNTNWKAAANPYQTLDQPLTNPTIGSSSSLPSFSSVTIVNTVNPPPLHQAILCFLLQRTSP